jgi:hypothetical protein
MSWSLFLMMVSRGKSTSDCPIVSRSSMCLWIRFIQVESGPMGGFERKRLLTITPKTVWLSLRLTVHLPSTRLQRMQQSTLEMWDPPSVRIGQTGEKGTDWGKKTLDESGDVKSKTRGKSAW